MNDNERLLSKKNTLALEQANIALNKKVLEQQIRLDTMQATLTAISTRMAALELVVLQQRATTAGHGPTVK